MTKISVIIPVYMVEQYLKRCLDSVINQTLKDVEIILIDDCGNDNSYNIAKDYAKNYKNITLIKNDKNRGQGYSRNIGISLAKGEYIAFLDADDWIEPQTYEKCWEKAKQTNADIVKCEFVYKYPKHDIAYSFNYSEIAQDKTYNVEEKPFYILSELITAVWNGLYLTEFLKKNKLRFNETVRFEDIIFCWETNLKAQNIYFLKDSKYYNYNKTNQNQDTQNFKIVMNVYSTINNLIKPLIFLQKEFTSAFILFVYFQLSWPFNLKKSNKYQVFKNYYSIISTMDKTEMKYLPEKYKTTKLNAFLNGNFLLYRHYNQILKIKKTWRLFFCL